MGPSLLLLALTAALVRQDGTPLRNGCGAEDEIVGTLRAGDRVEIRFAMAGEAESCFKVSAASDGKSLEGYLPASALDTAAFDTARRSGRIVGGRRDAPAQADAIAQRAIGVGGNGPLDRAGQLLSSGQPGEALALIESMLKLDGKNASLLAFAGYAAYRADDPKTAVYYLRQSLEIQPQPAVEQLLRTAEHEIGADQSSARIYSTRFLLRYEEVVPAELARQMVSVLESEFARISAELGCPAEERIVTVVQSREAYLRTTQAAEWSGGQYDGRIHIALFEKDRVGAESARRFGHEIVHACLAATGRWPAWLHEGLAQRLTGDRVSPSILRQIDALKRAGRLPKLTAMGDNWSGLSGEAASVAYGLSLHAVNLFYLHHNSYGIRNLLQNPDRLPDIAADLDRRLAE